jgi:myosin-3
LLGVDLEEITDALLTNVITTAGETFVRRNAVVQACDARDAMAKALYSRLFSWIVVRANELLAPPEDANVCWRVSFSVSRSPLFQIAFNIGVLDIFGFENFPSNSFEQLCINVTNEQLHHYFHEHIFAWEQQEYEREGVQNPGIKFADNKVRSLSERFRMTWFFDRSNLICFLPSPWECSPC